MKNLFMLTLVLLVFAACQKQDATELGPTNDSELNELLSRYPAEITVDNFKEFTNAPKEVMNYFQKKHSQAAKPQKKHVPLNKFGCGVTGSIQAYGNFNSTWAPIGGVKVGNNCTTYSTQTYGNNICFPITPDCDQAMFCLEYDTDNLNGVTTFDLLKIQEHLLGIDHFTEVRQFLAADVNRSGKVTAYDMTLIRNMILRRTTAWPSNSSNLMFFSVEDYNDLQEQLNIGFTTEFFDELSDQTTSNSFCSNAPDRYAIKTGDVSGDFGF